MDYTSPTTKVAKKSNQNVQVYNKYINYNTKMFTKKQ